MTEIFIINSQFERVAKGVGRVEIDLPAGLYKVKFKAGTLIHEELIDLPPGPQPFEIRAPQLRFSSSAPIADTLTTHEYHQGPAHSLSHEILLRRGNGSQLLVYLRDLERPSRANPAAGLTLRDADGKLVVDLHKACRFYDNAPIPSAGCTLELDPGVYRLCVEIGEMGSLEQSVVTCNGWQTQVFLLRRSYGRGNKLRRADLPNASILMARTGFGFDPGELQARWTDLARQGLANGRAVMSEKELWEMLNGKFDNPMLGIYGGHLLLLSATPSRDLVREVVKNLHLLVGNHPDVVALNLWLGEDRVENVGEISYSLPPMLRSSWQLIIQESARKPDIVPIGSLAARAANRLWNEGALLVWFAPDEPAANWSTQGIDLSSLDALLPQLGEKLSRTKSLKKFAAKAGLDDLETGLLYHFLGQVKREKVAAPLEVETIQHKRGRRTKKASDLPQVQLNLAPTAERTEIAESFGIPPNIAPTAERTEIVKSLGVPQATVCEALAGLASKLKLKL